MTQSPWQPMDGDQGQPGQQPRQPPAQPEQPWARPQQPAQQPQRPAPPPYPPYQQAYPYQGHPAPGTPLAGPAVPRRRSPLPWLLAAVAVLTLLCCGGGTAVVLIVGDETAGLPEAGRPEARHTATPEDAAPPGAEPTAPAATTPPPIPDDAVYRGRGNKVVRLSLSPELRHTATVTHGGRRHFAVWGLDEAGDQRDLVVNDVGRYSGVRPLDFRETPHSLRIEADGAWTVTVRAFAKTPLWNGRSAGDKPAVLRLDGAATGPTRVAVTHTGRQNFTVWAHTEQTEYLLVNVIGRYAGEVRLPPDTVAVSVNPDGNWTLTRR